jgi:threonylcarbamoyladenosine tRNA methylthiotransferase MtaB
MMKVPRAAFLTLGCKTNHYETDAIRAQFAQAGYVEVPFDGAADVYLVNTCTVTGEADRKSRQMLRRARRANPGAILVALGCQVELSRTAGLADILVGTLGKANALALVQAELARRGGSGDYTAVEATATGGAATTATAAATTAAATFAREHQVRAGTSDLQYEEFPLTGRPSETRAYIKIEDGCDNFCAYCTIPLARGPVRSRTRANILAEAEAVAAAGFQEIVLTGIHVCSYGAEQGLPSHTVMELARDLAAIPGISRIRLGSLEPQSITPEFVRLARQNPKLLPHFHLSLQSGSDGVLRRMGRLYNKAEYRARVERLREAFGVTAGGRLVSPGLTTDVMVGFPGETEAEHEESLAFCREMAFSRLHVFRYSSRPGTAAATMANPVDPQVIARRGQEMLALADELALDFHRRQVGRPAAVLLEDLQADGHYAGYTPEYVPARIPAAPGLAAGQIIEVAVVAAERDFVVGYNANGAFSCYDKGKIENEG